MNYRNLSVLALSTLLSISGASIVALTAGIIGAELAPSLTWATLPASLMVVGLALMTIPAAMIMKRIGRRKGFILSAVVAGLSALLAAYAIALGSFALFCLAVLLIGTNSAFAQQYRFAAAESVQPRFAGRAVSFLLLSGVVAGFIGPEIAKRTKDLLPVAYSGSFVALAVFYALVIGILLFMREVKPAETEAEVVSVQGRTAATPDRQPAELPGGSPGGHGGLWGNELYHDSHAGAYAQPGGLHPGCYRAGDREPYHCHVLALALHRLSARAPGRAARDADGHRRHAGDGAAGSGQQRPAGVLGRAGFAGCWVELPVRRRNGQADRHLPPSERFKAQGFNDFSIFSVQALLSLSAGVVLFRTDWGTLNLLMLPLLALVLTAIVLTRKGRVNQELGIVD